MKTLACTSCKRCRRFRLRVYPRIAFAILHALFFPRLLLSPLTLPCPVSHRLFLSIPLGMCPTNHFRSTPHTPQCLPALSVWTPPLHSHLTPPLNISPHLILNPTLPLLLNPHHSLLFPPALLTRTASKPSLLLLSPLLLIYLGLCLLSLSKSPQPLILHLSPHNTIPNTKHRYVTPFFNKTKPKPLPLLMFLFPAAPSLLQHPLPPLLS